MLLSEKLNRRTSMRTQLIKEMSVTDSSGNEHKLFSYNYSLTGIAIFSQQQMEVGDVFKLKFVIPQGYGSSMHLVNAEVVQNYSVGALHISGLKFEQQLKLH